MIDLGEIEENISLTQNELVCIRSHTPYDGETPVGIFRVLEDCTIAKGKYAMTHFSPEVAGEMYCVNYDIVEQLVDDGSLERLVYRPIYFRRD